MKSSEQQAGIGLMERQVLDKMAQLGNTVLRTKDLEEALGYTRQQATMMLSRLFKKGCLQRLKAGIYWVVPLGTDSADPIPDDALVIGAALFDPCYISGWTAAEHWGLTDQIFNAVVVCTTQKQRKKNHLIAGLRYRTKYLSAEHLFGTKRLWSHNKVVQIADLHRTVIDILDDPETGGGGRQTIDMVKAYFAMKEADVDQLWTYAEKLGKGSVFKRLGLILEKIAHAPQAYLERCHASINGGIIKFDPQGSNMGPIIRRWGIRLNIPSEDFT